MGSIDKRLAGLEASWNALARDEEERDAHTRRTLTRLIVAENARLRRSGEGNPGDLVEKACLAVAHDQYDHLVPEHRDELGHAWAEEMREWSGIDWGATTGNLEPPPGWR